MVGPTACSGERTNTSEPTPTEPDCHDGRAGAGQISRAEIFENPLSTLSFTVLFDTSEPTTAEVTVESQTGDTFTLESSEATRTHAFEVYGLRPETGHRITIRTLDDRGRCSLEALGHQTGGLPPDLPPIEVLVTEPEAMQPGITLFSVNPFGGNNVRYLVGVDETGTVVWYHELDQIVEAVRRLENGHLLFEGELGVTELDMMNHVVEFWSIEDLGLDVVHHEIIVMPNGHYVGLSGEVRTVGGFPDGTGNVEYDVVGDLLYELRPSDATIVDRWSLFDVLSPFDRFETNELFDGKHWDEIFTDTPSGSTKDWTHANALQYIPEDDAFLVSLRNLDWVIHLSRAHPGEVTWRLGEGGDFRLTEGEWFYGQHGAEQLENGHILLFDNGLNRPSGELYSRAVEYAVDHSASDRSKWTAKQVWEFRDDEPFYSAFVSDADILPNGNVLVTDANRQADPDLGEASLDNLKWIRIAEVTHTDPPRKVFEILARKELGDGFHGYHGYRALRFALRD